MRPHPLPLALPAAALLLALIGPGPARAGRPNSFMPPPQDRVMVVCTAGCPEMLAVRHEHRLRELASEGASRIYSAGKHYVHGLGQAVALLVRTAGTLAG